MIEYKTRQTVEQVEEGTDLAPRFDEHGLIPAIVTDHANGHVLMQGFMNDEALRRTLETGEAHFWSRSRRKLWRKGETSGLVQKVVQCLIDDDQDCVWLRVEVAGGASCHVGYLSCFYREIKVCESGAVLEFTEKSKTFDPKAVYGDLPNPTKL